MNTISSLCCYGREQADLTEIICGNGSYAILENELGKVEAASDGERARRLLDPSSPSLDFAALQAVAIAPRFVYIVPVEGLGEGSGLCWKAGLPW